MSSQPKVQVRVTRRFDAPSERVFDACLDPELIGQWMFGKAPREQEVLRIALDARVGGEFSFLVRRDGQEIEHVGRYLAIERPKRLAFTWGVAGESADESRVTIDIAADGPGCRLTLTHDIEAKWAQYAERTQTGWSRMLDVLATLLDRA